MLFQMLYETKLAQAAYFIGCEKTNEAIVIDPQRDIERYLKFADDMGMQITAIAETHIHADFLSGARELAEQTGACLYLSNEGGDDWRYTWMTKKEGGGCYPHRLVENGYTFRVGGIVFKVLHTPGHTPEHICFSVTDQGGGVEEPMGIASGDFVFVGSVGRPDLLETAAGQSGAKEKSARSLYQSLQRFTQIPDYLQLWPGHGSGSACGKSLGAVPQSTVGYEKRFNPAFSKSHTEKSFITSILSGQVEPPHYFARMKYENRNGPPILGEIPSPKEAQVCDIAKAVDKGAALIDTRTWDDYATGHLPGALHNPLTNAFPTVAGSYIESGKPIYLIVDKVNVREAVIDLIHVGLDNVIGYAAPDKLVDSIGSGEPHERSRQLDIAELKNRKNKGDVILDVRSSDEFDAGHMPEALNIAHTRLLPRLHEIPKDRPILVHCLGGLRSAFAVGMLQSRGFLVTQLNGGFERWKQVGGEIVQNN